MQGYLISKPTKRNLVSIAPIQIKSCLFNSFCHHIPVAWQVRYLKFEIESNSVISDANSVCLVPIYSDQWRTV